jgi:hypothetical protein
VRDGFAIRDEAITGPFGRHSASQAPYRRAAASRAADRRIEGQPLAAGALPLCRQSLVLVRYVERGTARKCPTTSCNGKPCSAKAAGCTCYDLWGAPDEFNENDPLWGVYRFKEGLGGTVVRHLGAWDLPVQPWLYKLYTQTLPRVLEVMRRRGKKRVERAVL